MPKITYHLGDWFVCDLFFIYLDKIDLDTYVGSREDH